MTNWKDIHPNFTPELRREWEDRGFSKSECKEWVSIGLQPLDYDLCAWLKNIVQETPENILNYGSKKNLQEQYQQFLKNKINFEVDLIKVKKLTPELIQQWQLRGFKDAEINSWIDAGLRVRDFEYASWLNKVFKMNPFEYKNLDEIHGELLWGEYKKHLQSRELDAFTENTQGFLELGYSKEKRNKIKIIDLSNKKVEGELTLSNFPSLEKVFLANNAISKLKVDNCPNLKEINVSNNSLMELDLSQLTQLEHLYCSNNKLHKLNVSQNRKLKSLFCFRNSLTELKGINFLSKLERFYGNKSLQTIKSMLSVEDTWGLNFNPFKVTKSVAIRINSKKTTLQELNYYLKSGESNHVRFSAWRAISCQQDIHGNIWLLNKEEKQRIIDTFNTDDFEALTTIIVDIMQERGNFQSGQERIEPILNQIISSREQLKFAQDELLTSQGKLLIIQEAQKNRSQNSLKMENSLNDNLQNNSDGGLVIAQDWLDKNYPQEVRKEIDILTIKNENLLGHLDLSDFINLKMLEIWESAVTSLNIEKNEKLTYFFSFDDLFRSHGWRMKENARKIFREEFTVSAGRPASDREIEEWFELTRDYNTDNYSVVAKYILMEISKESLIEYLEGLPDKIEVKFDFKAERSGIIHILWRAYQIKNMPLIALESLGRSSIPEIIKFPPIVMLRKLIKFFLISPFEEDESRKLQETLRERIIHQQQLTKQLENRLIQAQEKRRKIITEIIRGESQLLQIIAPLIQNTFLNQLEKEIKSPRLLDQSKVKKIIQSLTEIRSSLNNYRKQIEQLQIENEQLQEERSKQLIDLPLIVEQLTKNELIIKEKQRALEELVEKVKKLEIELDNLSEQQLNQIQQPLK